MVLTKLKSIFLMLIILCLLISGCSMFEIDADHSNGKLPTSKGLNGFIGKRGIKNIVHTENLYNKYTLIIHEETPKKYGYYITTSYYGRVVMISSNESESQDDISDIIIRRRTSTPEFLLIRINELCLPDINKIVIRYTVQNNNDIKEIVVTSVSKYNIITNKNNEEIVTNIIDTEVYNNDNKVIFKREYHPPKKIENIDNKGI